MSRHALITLAAVFCAIAIIGSVAPFTFVALPWADAVARIEIPNLARLSRFDLVANVVLFVPIGCFLMGAFESNRGSAIAAGRILIITLCLSAGLEAAQLFTPSRTPSLADFLAEQTGAVAGITLWTLRGRDAAAWVGRMVAERERPGPALRVLIAYVVVWSLARLFPFDATLDVHQLAKRLADGRIVLIPFAGGDSPARLSAEALMATPVGALAALGWTEPGIRRGPAGAAASALLFTATIGLAQSLIDSQSADITRVAAGAAGALCGAVMTIALFRGTAKRQRSESVA